jgi:hypothetical protein
MNRDYAASLALSVKIGSWEPILRLLTPQYLPLFSGNPSRESQNSSKFTDTSTFSRTWACRSFGKQTSNGFPAYEPHPLPLDHDVPEAKPRPHGHTTSGSTNGPAGKKIGVEREMDG